MQNYKIIIDYNYKEEDIIEEAVLTFNMYADKPNINCMSLETIPAWLHNYPIPDDELDNKTASIAEVEAGVRSKKSYIEEFGNAEDAEAEFQRILDNTNVLREAFFAYKTTPCALSGRAILRRIPTAFSARYRWQALSRTRIWA